VDQTPPAVALNQPPEPEDPHVDGTASVAQPQAHEPRELFLDLSLGRHTDSLVRWSIAGAVTSRLALAMTMGTDWFLPTGRKLINDRGDLTDAQNGPVIASLLAAR